MISPLWVAVFIGGEERGEGRGGEGREGEKRWERRGREGRRGEERLI